MKHSKLLILVFFSFTILNGFLLTTKTSGSDNFLVYSDGLAIESKKLLLERYRALYGGKFEKIASPIAGDPTNIGYPVSKSGNLNTSEVYTDPKDNTLGYYLPAYRVTQLETESPPRKRYQVSLEFIGDPGEKAIARLKVNLTGYNETALSDNSTRITFDTLQDGTPITADRFLNGNEFLDKGIRLATALQGSYCADAVTSIRRAGPYGVTFPFLTSASPGAINRCNGVPVAITFTHPVRYVSLTFAGASVTYTMKAYDGEGKHLGTVQGDAVLGGGTFDISFSSASANISKVVFGHQAAITAIKEIRYGLTPESPTGSGLYPLPHDVTVSLRYIVSEKTNSASGVSTWKEIQFDEVKQKGETEIEATLHLYSLPELDYIYKVMSDEKYRCQLIIHCEADLSYRTLNQIYIRHPLPYIKLTKKPIFKDLKLEILPPPPKLNLVEVIRKGTTMFNYGTALDAIREKPLKNIFFHLQPEISIHRGSRAVSPFILSDTHVISNAITPSLHILPIKNLVTHTEFSVLKDKLRKYPLKLSDSQDFMLPSHYFTDRNGDPAYVKVRASYDQKIPFNFPTSIHGYIYPNYEPQGEVALLRYQVSHDQAIYQDTSQPSLFYCLPDAFRLTREDVPSHRPALQVAFYSLSTKKESGSGINGQTNYNVEFTFKAVPYLNPDRERTALDYIIENNLVSDSVVPILAPIIPESARLFLRLPKEGGGTEVVERQEADIVFPQHIVDSLILSSKAFAEIFHSMCVGGETLNGTIKIKLPGRNEEQMIEFNGRLDKMLGPIVEEFLVGHNDDIDETYRVGVINAIESRIELSEVVVFLLADPRTNRWVPAIVNAGTLPLSLDPGEKREIIVQPTESIPHSWGVRLKPIKAKVDLDFESLWLSVLETPGWGDINHQVTVKVNERYFNGPNALDKVIVTFNHEEAIVELKKEVLTDTVELTKPILPYLLREEEANDYFYRVNSWRNEQLVGTSNILEDDSPELQIVPPLE